jgi:hypothetical protein
MYIIILFQKVLCNLNFVQVEIITVVYVCTYVCMFVICKKNMKTLKIYCKHRKLIFRTTIYHLHSILFYYEPYGTIFIIQVLCNPGCVCTVLTVIRSCSAS